MIMAYLSVHLSPLLSIGRTRQDRRQTDGRIALSRGGIYRRRHPGMIRRVVLVVHAANGERKR